MKRNLLLLSATLLIGACGIHTRYTRPQLDIDTDSLYRTPAPADTGSLATLPWRTFFTDTLLQQLMEQGLHHNTDLLLARQLTAEAQATLTHARKAMLPTADLTAQAAISHSATTARSWEATMEATWEADIFGKLDNARRGAKAALESSRQYEQAVQTQLLATIAESYYTLLLLDEQLDISRHTLDIWDQTVSTLQALAMAGRTNDVAVHQAKASRTALQASILSIKESISQTENSLSALLGQTARHIPRTTLHAQQIHGNTATGLPMELLANRPDIRQAEAELAEAFYATNAARSAFYPSLTLSGTAGWTGSSGKNISSPTEWLSGAVAQLTAPFLNRHALKANLRIAKARQEEARLRFTQLLLQAGNEVNDALCTCQTADQRTALDKQQTEELEAAAEKTRLLVKYTSANYLEVLTAQQALLSAQLTLAQDSMDKLMGMVRLYHALGGGTR